MLACLMCLLTLDCTNSSWLKGQSDSKSQLKLAVQVQMDSKKALLNAQTPNLVGRWE